MIFLPLYLSFISLLKNRNRGRMSTKSPRYAKLRAERIADKWHYSYKGLNMTGWRNRLGNDVMWCARPLISVVWFFLTVERGGEKKGPRSISRWHRTLFPFEFFRQLFSLFYSSRAWKNCQVASVSDVWIPNCRCTVRQNHARDSPHNWIVCMRHVSIDWFLFPRICTAFISNRLMIYVFVYL